MTLSLLGFALLFVVCFLGVPLGFSMLLVGILGFAMLRDSGAAYSMAAQQIMDFSNNYTFSVVPLFILMGAFVHRAQLTEELYDAANAWLGHLRGGLAMATIVACGALAAVCGSSVATAAMMSKVAFPPMRRYGYANSLAAGSIAAGGTLGILIPPSVPLIVFGILTDSDIAKLFIAGIIPGLLLIALYCGAIAIFAMAVPGAAPPGPRVAMRQRLQQIRRVWGVVLLFVLVLGGMYGGVFTATEAAGIGASSACLYALARGRLGWRELGESLVEAGTTTAMIFVVAFGALVFGNFVNLAGLTGAMVDWINTIGASPVTTVLVICAIYLVLGCFFDSLAMLLLTVPVFAPIVAGLGVDLIWFGIIVIICVEAGLITPPIGMNVFVVKSIVPDVDLWTMFRGVWPFVAADIVLLALLIALPAIATFLPRLMSG